MMTIEKMFVVEPIWLFLTNLAKEVERLRQYIISRA